MAQSQPQEFEDGMWPVDNNQDLLISLKTTFYF
jgi:hypothetical protein